MYLVDKYMVFCYYKNLPDYNLEFTTMFTVIAGIAIILHFFFAIWIYGEPALFSTNPNEFEGRTFIDKLEKRFKREYNWFLFGLLIICGIYFLFCLIFGFKPCCFKEEKKEKNNYRKTFFEFGFDVEDNLLKEYTTALTIELVEALKEGSEKNKQYWKNLFKSIQYYKNCLCDKKKIADIDNRSLIKETYNHITNHEIRCAVILNYLKNM